MYILSDLQGNLIQKSNAKVDNLQELINKFSAAYNTNIIGTTDETLYQKSELAEHFNTVIENGMIKDIEVHESPIITEPYKLTVEDRLTAVELALLEVL